MVYLIRIGHPNRLGLTVVGHLFTDSRNPGKWESTLVGIPQGFSNNDDNYNGDFPAERYVLVGY